MDVTRTELQKHAERVNALLETAWQLANPAPLVKLTEEGTLSLAPSCPSSLAREVTTDLGIREVALRVPPSSSSPRFWVAFHERWEWKTKYKVKFRDCGLRLYMGERSEEATQFLRLEWVAPESSESGTLVFQGKHAGHPHWHIDSAALVGDEEYWRALELLTAPSEILESEAEEFSEASVFTSKPALNFSWIQKLHLPARAHWMKSEWDGQSIPGPHQCEPEQVEELTKWWAGALRYLASELPE